MIDEAIARQLSCAQAKMEAGQFENAVTVCETLLESSPSCLPALRMLARAATELGQIELAQTSFRACSVIDPEDDMAHIGMALCADAQGDAETAVAEFWRAYELSPNDRQLADELERRGAEVWDTPLMQARRALAEGKPERAGLILEESGRMDDLATQLTYANALWQLGRVEDVWELCWPISKEFPTCLRALYWLRESGELVEKPLYVRMIRKLIEQIAPGLEPYTETINPIACPQSNRPIADVG